MTRINIFTLSLLLAFYAIYPESLKTAKSIAIIDFKGEGIEQGVANNFSNKFRRLLIEENLYNVVERDNMYAILKEQGYQQSGCMSTECVVDVGKLIGVNYMIAGGVGKVGLLFIVTARLVNVGTGKIEKEIETADKIALEDLYLTGVEKLFDDMFMLAPRGLNQKRILFHIETQSGEKLRKDSINTSGLLEIVKAKVVLPVYAETRYYYYVRSPSGLWGFIGKTWVKKVSAR